MHNELLIPEIASEISKYWEQLTNELVLSEISEKIKGNRVLVSENIIAPQKFGIYVFFIKPENVYQDSESLMDVWNIESFRKYPKVVKKRFNQCEALDGWFPFYIGKSEKLGTRINEHLNHHSQHATYGLKLKERTAFLKNNQIELGYWTLPEMEKVPREIKQFIITNLEFRLRGKMKPWIGKQ